MSRMRRRFATYSWFGAACLLLLVAVLIHSGAPQAYASKPVRAFTGEQLYRGLVLGHGEVADLIPQVRDHYRVSNFVTSVEELRLVEAMQDRMIASIDEMDPNFFREFRKMIRSGDHLVISEALAKARRVTVNSIGAIPEVQELRSRFSQDPSLRDQMLADLRQLDSTNQLTEADLTAAADILLAGLVDGLVDGPYQEDAIVAVFVAALAVLVTVAVAFAYATTINVAGAVNFYTAVAATTTITVTNGLTEPGSTSLSMEELIQSVSVQLAV